MKRVNIYLSDSNVRYFKYSGNVSRQANVGLDLYRKSLRESMRSVEIKFNEDEKRAIIRVLLPHCSRLLKLRTVEQFRSALLEISQQTSNDSKAWCKAKTILLNHMSLMEFEALLDILNKRSTTHSSGDWHA